jgi:BirA family transcriptional regulator, biotin operon repressor / biotin---[acetyl-CoA-carboxylase] ligase
MAEPLPADLAEALDRSAGSRGRFGAPVMFLPETGSTNDVALAMAERGAPEGAMVIALAQTAGRGRMGRVWYSPPGAGLYVSLVCRTIRALPFLTLAGGVAVADGIRSATGLPVSIKWPNDVVVPDETAPGRRRKLAGVLAEGSSGADGLHYVVLGVGINLQPAAYPPELASRATSIETELGRPVDRGRVLADALSTLNHHVTTLGDGATSGLLARWRALAPTSVGARVEWTENGATRSGTTSGIDDDGALLVRTPDRVERIRSGEVTWQ